MSYQEFNSFSDKSIKLSCDLFILDMLLVECYNFSVVIESGLMVTFYLNKVAIMDRTSFDEEFHIENLTSRFNNPDNVCQSIDTL